MKVYELFEEKDSWKEEILKVIADDSTDLARSLKPPFGTLPVPVVISQVHRLIRKFKKAGIKVEENTDEFKIGNESDHKLIIDLSKYVKNAKDKPILSWK